MRYPCVIRETHPYSEQVGSSERIDINIYVHVHAYLSLCAYKWI